MTAEPVIGTREWARWVRDGGLDILKAQVEDLERFVPEPATEDADAGFVSIQTYLEGVPKDVQWIVPDIIYEGGSSLLSGPPKVGKSTYVAALMQSLENGTPFLDRYVGQRPIALLTEESGLPVQFKYGMLKTLDVMDKSMYPLDGWHESLQRVHQWAQAHPGGVVFIDTLSVWAGIEDENDASKVTQRMTEINLVKANNSVGIVLVHHARKSGGDNGEAVRGSGAMTATVDNVVEMARYGAHSTKRYIDVMSRVLPEQKRLLIDFDPIAREYSELEADDAKLEEIEDYLDGIPTDGDGMSVSALAEQWDVARSTARKRAEWLANAGRMRERMGKVGPADAHLYWAIPAAV